MGGESARSFTEYYVDILFALNKKYFDNLRHWLTEMVNTDNFPTANITKEQKQQFATFVLRERTNKRKLLEVTREFSLACCGLVSLYLQRIQPSFILVGGLNKMTGVWTLVLITKNFCSFKLRCLFAMVLITGLLEIFTALDINLPTFLTGGYGVCYANGASDGCVGSYWDEGRGQSSSKGRWTRSGPSLLRHFKENHNMYVVYALMSEKKTIQNLH